MRIKRGILTLLSLFFGALLLWCVGFVLFARQINSYSQNKDITDAVVVLTGGRHRIEEGVSLLNAGIGSRLFISGVSKNISIADIAQRSGLKIRDARQIELGYEATDTIGNAAEISRWVQKNDIRSIHLVTSNYHLPRALEELSVYQLPIEVIAYPVYSEKIAHKWWHSFATFKLLAAEYNKFLYTYFNHRIQQIVEM